MKLVKLIGLTVLLAAGITAVNAQTPNPNATYTGVVWGGTGSNNTQQAISVSAVSANGGMPVLTALAVNTTTVSNYAVHVYVAIPGMVRATTNAAGSTFSLKIANTNGFSNGDFIILRNVTNDTYTLAAISNATAIANNFELDRNVGGWATGDLVYKARRTLVIGPPVARSTATQAGTLNYFGQNELNLYVPLGEPGYPVIIAGTNKQASAAGGLEVSAAGFYKVNP